MPTCAFVSFRLGTTDGVSVVARTWQDAFEGFGYDTVTVAGDGPVDRTVAGLGLDAREAPSTGEVEGALSDADLVVVENLLTIPMNLPASRVVAEVLRGRPTLVHHHDPPWQRERFAHVTELPVDDPAWRHVTINDLTRRQMAARGITATCIHNGFDPDPPTGDRSATRASLGIADDETLVVHPVRAIERKRIPDAIEEMLRWVSPLNNMFRTAARDTEVNGQPIAEGERVALLYPAANRDPAAITDPDRFDIAREPTPHLAFGHGTHFCVGANLARLEVRLLLEELTPRITNLRPVTEPDIEPNVFARAVRRFDLGFDLR